MKDSLGDRMKSYYEGISKTKLIRRMPVAIRLDGKAFHTFTRGFNKPYDVVFSDAMCRTLKSLCENIQGCVIGYTQSDEITLVLVDYKTLNTIAWFDNEVQKICSISASMTSVFFTRYFCESVDEFSSLVNGLGDSESLEKLRLKYMVDPSDKENLGRLCEVYSKAVKSNAVFDSRVFNIPKEEVANMFVWRQQDATRNSIEMLGQHYFGHNRLFRKNCSNIQDMLMNEFNVNWNDVPVKFKRGVCCTKKDTRFDEESDGRWYIDLDIPIFTQDRGYIEQWIYVGEGLENESKG